MNVLSLFDGMSCAQMALQGHKIDNYYAAEIDPYAIKVTQANFPNTVQLGSVTDYLDWQLDWASIDLITFGSPCQGLSCAGKGKGLNDERSKLFFTAIDIIKLCQTYNPNVKWFFENVVPNQKELTKIEYCLLDLNFYLYSIILNSSDFTPQSRKRLYMANFELTKPSVKPRTQNLKDIIESGYVDRKTAHCIDANYYKGGNLKSYFQKGRRQLVFHDGSLWYDRLVDTPETKAFYRKLSPIECERLQGVPDNYTNHVSNTQRYKMLGNGWTVPVIAHLLERI